ncbi:MAG TPA: hypothetical protein VKH19_01890 [Gemmatimonadaceae bacterium]|nr:hypothetical protein [Gemmatimonadaceae bacterium]
MASTAYARAASPTPSATSPAYGDQSTTIDVHVLGSGFGPDATARWLLHGVEDPSQVKTNRTTYVSSTEVIANITIAPAAKIDYWDVQMMSGGKTGVGVELFEVTTAIALNGLETAYGVNDLGMIVGSNSAGAWFRDVDGTVTQLSSVGGARAIDPAGLVIVANSDGVPVAYERASTTSPWSRVLLPVPAGNNAAYVQRMRAAGDGSGDLLVAGYAARPVKNLSYQTAVLWRRTAAGAWTVQVLPCPAGNMYSRAQDVAASGTVIGWCDKVITVWTPGVSGFSATVLPNSGSAAPIAISANGQFAVGHDAGALMWARNRSDGSWTLSLLATGGAPGGSANAVTDDGTAYGTAQDKKNFGFPAVWASTTAAPINLGGLGHREVAAVTAISPSNTYAVGRGDLRNAALWILLP